MQRKVQAFIAVCAIMAFSSLTQAQTETNTTSSAGAPSAQQVAVSASSTPSTPETPVNTTLAAPSSESAPTPPATPVPTPAPKINVQIENLTPPAGALETGRMNYMRYCADCHGANGEGKKGPKLVGSLIVTGPVYGHLSIVLNGHDKTIMPTWGISEISDDVIASIITYQRNAWGNNNKKEYGRHAGGVVSSEWVHVYRKMMKNLPVKQDVRT